MNELRPVRSAKQQSWAFAFSNLIVGRIAPSCIIATACLSQQNVPDTHNKESVLFRPFVHHSRTQLMPLSIGGHFVKSFDSGRMYTIPL